MTFDRRRCVADARSRFFQFEPEQRQAALVVLQCALPGLVIRLDRLNEFVGDQAKLGIRQLIHQVVEPLGLLVVVVLFLARVEGDVDTSVRTILLDRPGDGVDANGIVIVGDGDDDVGRRRGEGDGRGHQSHSFARTEPLCGGEVVEDARGSGLNS